MYLSGMELNGIGILQLSYFHVVSQCISKQEMQQFCLY